MPPSTDRSKDSNQRRTVLDHWTFVPLGACVSAGLICFSAYIWLTNQLNDIKMEIRMTRIAQSNYMTKEDMQVWAGQLRELNGNAISVPDPSLIFHGNQRK